MLRRNGFGIFNVRLWEPVHLHSISVIKKTKHFDDLIRNRTSQKPPTRPHPEMNSSTKNKTKIKYYSKCFFNFPCCERNMTESTPRIN